MNHFFIALAGLSIVVHTPAGQAAVVSRDWKANGDGLLTYDAVNRREWLDLTETRLINYAGRLIEERFQSFLVELQPGGQFDGFSLAEFDDLTALATSAGINTQSLDDYLTNEMPTRALMHLVGVSLVGDFGDREQSYGVVEGQVPSGPVIRQAIGLLTADSISGPNGQAGVVLTSPGDRAVPANTGVWLYRLVPEPSGACLFGLGIIIARFIKITSRKRG